MPRVSKKTRSRPSVADSAEAISARLAEEVGELAFGDPVDVVYNPLEYAWAPHRAYVRRYARRGIRALLLGMNPGPWGMAQTGVPFGEVEMVRTFLGIEAEVDTPKIEHPKRPITGFACTRREVSGARLWGWVAERFIDADAFFDDFFVWNDCPLSFMEAGGRNRTPDKLPIDERRPLEAACGRGLRAMVDLLQPEMVVGVGGHATRRLEATLADRVEAGMRVGTILHPSPASPAANRGWAPVAEAQMIEMGLLTDR
ncbi:MAG: uracil-DNA glycosylase family protein [Planctomycetota bacterium]|jgi:single-strand selective monofunctional uracil DNA glycosylase